MDILSYVVYTWYYTTLLSLDVGWDPEGIVEGGEWWVEPPSDCVWAWGGLFFFSSSLEGPDRSRAKHDIDRRSGTTVVRECNQITGTEKLFNLMCTTDSLHSSLLKCGQRQLVLPPPHCSCSSKPPF